MTIPEHEMSTTGVHLLLLTLVTIATNEDNFTHTSYVDILVHDASRAQSVQEPDSWQYPSQNGLADARIGAVFFRFWLLARFALAVPMFHGFVSARDTVASFMFF